MNNKIKIITEPDIIFDQAVSILVITPSNDLKSNLQNFLLNSTESFNVYLFTESNKDIKWLLTIAKSVDYVLVDIDNISENVYHFLSYILSIPTTYYKCNNMQVPWDLLNQNRFYDFPDFNREDKN